VQRVVIYGVTFDVVNKQPIVLLRTEGTNRFLPIWIGNAEALAILSHLKGTRPERPMTHDLLATVVSDLQAEVVQIAVTELRDATFHAKIVLRADSRTVEIDCRPSDALALAIRTSAPIFVADDVIERSAVEMDEDQPDLENEIEEFRRFLDDVGPDEFRYSDG